jgi:cell wall-associated NlpC family hydrolase
MIPTYFDSPARLYALEISAQEWLGTPFFANSEAFGRDGGVDCVRLLHAIYSELGVIPRIEIPPQVMDAGQHSGHSLLLEAFETWPVLRERFARVPDCSAANILPGDALCFVAGRVPHHGGLMLGAGLVLHALKPEGVHRMQLTAVIRGRRILGELAAIYRPLPLP